MELVTSCGTGWVTLDSFNFHSCKPVYESNYCYRFCMINLLLINFYWLVRIEGLLFGDDRLGCFGIVHASCCMTERPVAKRIHRMQCGNITIRLVLDCKQFVLPERFCQIVVVNIIIGGNAVYGPQIYLLAHVCCMRREQLYPFVPPQLLMNIRGIKQMR